MAVQWGYQPSHLVSLFVPVFSSSSLAYDVLSHFLYFLLLFTLTLHMACMYFYASLYILCTICGSCFLFLITFKYPVLPYSVLHNIFLVIYILLKMWIVNYSIWGDGAHVKRFCLFQLYRDLIWKKVIVSYYYLCLLSPTWRGVLGFCCSWLKSFRSTIHVFVAIVASIQAFCETCRSRHSFQLSMNISSELILFFANSISTKKLFCNRRYVLAMKPLLYLHAD